MGRALRRSLAGLFAAALLGAPAWPHPGNGIAVATDGTVYFTDVGRRTIWSLAADGSLEPLVRPTWTHCVRLGADGTLYYEREEPVDGVAPCSLWKIAPDGERVPLIAPAADRARFAGGPFVVAPGGEVYFAHAFRDGRSGWRTGSETHGPRVRRVAPGGTVTTLALVD